jgi:hypothetical protein
MKHLLILTLLFSFTPKPAKAEITTVLAIGIGVMVGLIVSDYLEESQ